jgi:hypothetical protein
MITIEQREGEDFITMRAAGKLTGTDYDAAVPEIENLLELHGKPLRMMIRLEEFRGWDLGALWDDLRFDVKHHDDFGRVAVVGDSKWQEWGAKLSNPFFGSEIRYFDWNDMDSARAWLSE